MKKKISFSQWFPHVWILIVIFTKIFIVKDFFYRINILLDFTLAVITALLGVLIAILYESIKRKLAQKNR